MAAAIVQQASGNTGTGTPTSIDPTLASNDTVGNWLILIVTSDATVSTPSGWALDKSQVNSAGHYVYRKATTGSDATWNIPVNSASSCWWVAEISGLDDTTPFDESASTGGVSGTTSRSTGTTGTTDTADEYLIGSASQSTTGTPTGPGSWTNSFVQQAYDNTTKGAGTNVSVMVATLVVSSTGTYETTAEDFSSAASTGIIVTYRVTGVAEAVLYPTSDVAGTGWDSAPTAAQDLFAQVDEVVASDTDYMFTEDPNP